MKHRDVTLKMGATAREPGAVSKPRSATAEPAASAAELIESIDVEQRSQRGTFEAILEWLADGPRGRVLDAPSGPGLLTEAMRRVGFDVRAADIDAGTFALHGRIPFTRLDLDDPLPFADASFDLVVCGDGIEHLENPFALFREFARVLPVGGRLVVATPNYQNMERRLYFLRSGSLAKPTLRRPGFIHGPKIDRGHINPLTLTRMACMAETADLELLSFRTAQPKRRQRWLAPLALAIRAEAELLSEKRRHDLFAEHTQSWRMLLGGKTLIAMFRKSSPPAGMESK